VRAVVTYTTSGSTALRAARERPAAPILSLTPNVRAARRLALVWGAHAIEVRELGHLTDIVDLACDIALREGFSRPGEIIAIAAGMPFGVAGSTNLLRIARLPEGPGHA
jgi:pyruvate kinase